LEAAGVNTLRTNLEVKDGKVAAASIEQAFPPTHCTCRSHRLQFAIFDSEASKVSLRKVVDIVVQPVAKTELPQLVGEASPAFVYPNFNDHGYAKVSLDEQSEKFGLENLEKFDDPLLRQLLWSDFYNMTRDAKMKSTAYLKLCREKITFETEPKLVQAVLSRVHAVLANFVPKALYAAEAKSLFEFGWNALQKAPAGEWQIVWAKFTVGIAADKESVEKLVQYLPEGSKVAGDFVLDQGMRWTVVQKSMGWGLPNARDLLAAEEKRDATDRGVRAALSAKSSWPDKETKAAAWERYIAKEHKKSYHMMASGARSFRS
jgi:aminopeptidase N